jgi:energy-coupling factor transport system ATP-binding protein
MILLKGVRFSYPDGRTVLDGFDLEVKRGEYLGLIGASGCGKSTLLNVIAGISPHRLRGTFSGTGTVDGRTLPYGPSASSSFCAYVHQEPEDTFVEGAVLDEVAFAPRCQGDPDDVAQGKASKALEILGIGRLAGCRTEDLSGGEKQLVAIASSLSAGHRLLLLDEPNSQLDPGGRMVVSRGLKALRASDPGLTILHVEQRQENLLRCDRIALLHGGRSVSVLGTLDQLMDRARLQRSGLGMDALASLYSAAAGRGLVPGRIAPWMMVPALTASLKGRSLTWTGAWTFAEREMPPVRLEGVRYRYPAGKGALRGIDLDLSGPGPVCIMGPNGSGKTTLGKVICGLLRPDRGSARVPGRSFHLFQRPGNMMFRDTVREELGSLPRKVPPSILRQLGLDGLLMSNPFSLSVGERQRLGIAMAYGADPEIAVLDEPFKGLDQRALEGVLQVLDMPEFPPFVIVTNEVDSAFLCRRAIVMNWGRVVSTGRPAEALNGTTPYDRLGWPVPGNVLMGIAAGSDAAPTYGQVEEAVGGSGA